jgi:hypothetical protein
VVLEVMSWQPGFAAAFTSASGGQARLDDLARHVCHGRLGDLRRAYHEGMEDQLGALGVG